MTTQRKHSHDALYQKERISSEQLVCFSFHLETHMINPVSLLCLFTRKFRAKSVAHLLWVYSTILCIMLTSCFLSYFMFNFHDNILYTIFSLSSYLFALSYWIILCNHIVWRKARWKCIFEWNYVPKTLHYFGIWHFENGDRALSDTEPLGYKQVCCKDKLEIFL